MSAHKGQASMIDLLLLGLFISIMLIASATVATSRLPTQIVREETLYSESMLMATMNWRNASYGSWNNSANISLAEALDLYLCSWRISEADMAAAVGYMLNSTVKPGYNYIFFVQRDTKWLWVWNRQADVCAEYIPLVTYELTPSCNWTNPLYPPMLGIWPEWKVLPPKSACANLTVGG